MVGASGQGLHELRDGSVRWEVWLVRYDVDGPSLGLGMELVGSLFWASFTPPHALALLRTERLTCSVTAVKPRLRTMHRELEEVTTYYASRGPSR